MTENKELSDLNLDSQPVCKNCGHSTNTSLVRIKRYYAFCWARMKRRDAYERIMGFIGLVHFLMPIVAWFDLIDYTEEK